MNNGCVFGHLPWQWVWIFMHVLINDHLQWLWCWTEWIFDGLARTWNCKQMSHFEQLSKSFHFHHPLVVSQLNILLQLVFSNSEIVHVQMLSNISWTDWIITQANFTWRFTWTAWSSNGWDQSQKNGSIRYSNSKHLVAFGGYSNHPTDCTK